MRPGVRLVRGIAWMIVGASLILGFLAMFTIGMYIVATGMALAGLLVWRGGVEDAFGPALAGSGLPMLYMAWLNRGGPGEVCEYWPGGFSCETRPSPWPWVGAAVVVVAAGVLIGIAMNRRRT